MRSDVDGRRESALTVVGALVVAGSMSQLLVALWVRAALGATTHQSLALIWTAGCCLLAAAACSVVAVRAPVGSLTTAGCLVVFAAWAGFAGWLASTVVNASLFQGRLTPDRLGEVIELGVEFFLCAGAVALYRIMLLRSVADRRTCGAS